MTRRTANDVHLYVQAGLLGCSNLHTNANLYGKSWTIFVAAYVSECTVGRLLVQFDNPENMHTGTRTSRRAIFNGFRELLVRAHFDGLRSEAYYEAIHPSASLRTPSTKPAADEETHHRAPMTAPFDVPPFTIRRPGVLHEDDRRPATRPFRGLCR